VAHTRHDDLQDGTTIGAQQMDLIDHDDPHHLHVAAGLPVARDSVPLLGRADDDVCCQECSQIRRVVSCTALYSVCTRRELRVIACLALCSFTCSLSTSLACHQHL
jgi:hypothetical protein